MLWLGCVDGPCLTDEKIAVSQSEKSTTFPNVHRLFEDRQLSFMESTIDVLY